MAAPWREEWIEVSSQRLSNGTSAAKGHAKYAKTLGDPPALPENNAEEMSNFFSAFMVSAVPRLPPSDPDIQTGKTKSPFGTHPG